MAFPKVNENELAANEKAEREAKWKTKTGFDILNKKENYNAHPKKPPVSKLEELQYPYHWQRAETEGRLRQKIYRPQDEGKSDFIGKV